MTWSRTHPAYLETHMLFDFFKVQLCILGQVLFATDLAGITPSLRGGLIDHLILVFQLARECFNRLAIDLVCYTSSITNEVDSFAR
jgi:hypothetical protein